MLKNPSLSDARRRLAEHGLRITPQRLLIYLELMGASDHPSADAVYRRVRRQQPNISFDTVFRTLTSFAEVGLIRVVEGGGETRRFETDLAGHHHFRCLQCHAIVDFTDPDYDRLAIPPALARKHRITSKRVVLEGVCAACKQRGRQGVRAKSNTTSPG